MHAYLPLIHKYVIKNMTFLHFYHKKKEKIAAQNVFKIIVKLRPITFLHELINSSVKGLEAIIQNKTNKLQSHTTNSKIFFLLNKKNGRNIGLGKLY